MNHDVSSLDIRRRFSQLWEAGYDPYNHCLGIEVRAKKRYRVSDEMLFKLREHAEKAIDSLTPAEKEIAMKMGGAITAHLTK